MKLKQQEAKKRLTINICRFMRTLKLIANTNTKKPPVHITPRAAVKINTSVFQKKKFIKSGISCGKTVKSQLICTVDNMLEHATRAGLKI